MNKMAESSSASNVSNATSIASSNASSNSNSQSSASSSNATAPTAAIAKTTTTDDDYYTVSGADKVAPTPKYSKLTWVDAERLSNVDVAILKIALNDNEYYTEDDVKAVIKKFKGGF